MTLDVLCIGEALIVLTPAAGHPLERAILYESSVAGAEANVAFGLAALGQRVRWCGVVGDDGFGRRIVSRFAAGGVSTEGVRVASHSPTGIYVKPGDGRPVLYYRQGSAGSRIDPADLRRWADRCEPRVVHTSGVGAQTSITARAAAAYLAAERPFRESLLSFDVNHRPTLADDATPETLRSLAQQSDIVFVGRDEAERLWGTRTPEEVRRFLPQPRWLIVKDAEHEAVEFGQGSPVVVPAPPVDVVEPTGAGDAFAAGWLDAFLRGATPEARLAQAHASAGRALTTRGDWADTAGAVHAAR